MNDIDIFFLLQPAMDHHSTHKHHLLDRMDQVDEMQREAQVDGHATMNFVVFL